MKNPKLRLRITQVIFILLLILNLAKAQPIDPCDSFQNCQLVDICKDVIFGSANNLGDCPFELCIEQELYCENNPECLFNFSLPNGLQCTQLSASGGTICFKQLINCPCYLNTTRITLKRIWSTDPQTQYSTITITGIQAKAFLDAFNPDNKTGFEFGGYINDCSGLVMAHQFIIGPFDDKILIYLLN